MKQFDIQYFANEISLTSGDDIYVNNEIKKKIYTLGGNDSVKNYANSSTIVGGSGDNTLENQGEEVSIYGGIGKDIIINYGNKTTLNGSNGNETIIHGSDESYISGGAGNDSIISIYFGKKNTISAGENDDIINSQSAEVSIVGNSGDNYLYSSSDGKKSTLEGGTGKDVISSHGDNSYLDGGKGSSSICAYGNNSTLKGGSGNDTLYSNAKNNLIEGFSGNNYIYADSDAENNTIIAGKGNDTIFLSEGAKKTLFQYVNGDGNDTVFGFNSDDTLQVIGSSYTKFTRNRDTIVKVGSGTITFKYTAETDVIVSGTENPSDGIIYKTPTQQGTLTFNGEEQTPVWIDFDSDQLSISGDYEKEIEVGDYKAKFTPINGYIWSGGSTSAKTATWTIEKASNSIRLSPSSCTVGAGDTETVTVSRSGSGKISASSLNKSIATASMDNESIIVTGIKAGSTTIKVSVGSDKNYKVPDTKTLAVAVQSSTPSVSDTKTSVMIPTVTNTSFTYDGTEHSPTITNAPAESVAKLVTGSTTKATKANQNGEKYSFTYRLVDTENYKWKDNTISDKKFEWTIGKATDTITVVPTSVHLTDDDKSQVISISKRGTGAVTLKSNDKDVASVSYSDKVYKISASEKTGSTKVTVTVAESKNYKSASTNVNVKSDTTDTGGSDTVSGGGSGGGKGLDDFGDDPSGIQDYIDGGSAKEEWKIGDGVDVELTGRLGGTDITGKYQFFIIGFDHMLDNETPKTNHSVHFGIRKIFNGEQRQVAFIQEMNNYGKIPTVSNSSFNFAHVINDEKQLFWKDSNILKLLNGGKNVDAENPDINTLWNAIPKKWRKVIPKTYKYEVTSLSDEGAPNVTKDKGNYLFIPSLNEMVSSSMSFQIKDKYIKADYGNQMQYEYYKRQNSHLIYKHRTPSELCTYWTRSRIIDVYTSVDSDDYNRAFCIRGTMQEHASGTEHDDTAFWGGKSGKYSYGIIACFSIYKPNSKK